MSFDGLDPAWAWLIVAALLAIAELAAPGIFLVWLAAAAALTGLTTFLLPLDLPFQLLLFGLYSIAAVLVGRRLYERSADEGDPLLNDRTARLIGETVLVVAAIEHGEGRVKVGDGVWPARGPDMPVGARVRIVAAEGACLRVEPAAALPPG
jgi:inner membrane protein